MPSQLRSETARINGAKSHGPVTAEGRAASSRNAVRHGLTASTCVLPTESVDEFNQLMDSYIDQFQPDNGVELDMVQTLVSTRWRLNRIRTLETSLLDLEMTRDQTSASGAFQKLANENKCLPLLLRYEGSLGRAFARALNQLRQLQTARIKEQRKEPSRPQPAEKQPIAVQPIAPVVHPVSAKFQQGAHPQPKNRSASVLSV